MGVHDDTNLARDWVPEVPYREKKLYGIGEGVAQLDYYYYVLPGIDQGASL